MVCEVKESEVAQSRPTLCNPMDCSLPVSSVHGIFQASILEWVAISSSRESSQPRDRTMVFRIVGRRCTIWATREAPGTGRCYLKLETDELSLGKWPAEPAASCSQFICWFNKHVRASIMCSAPDQAACAGQNYCGFSLPRPGSCQSKTWIK